MFFVAVGQSEELDAESVLEDLEQQCARQLDGRVPQAGIVFAAIDVEHEALLAGLAARWPGLELIGCTTDGELSSERGFCEDSVSLILFGSDAAKITAGLGRQVSADIPTASAAALDQALGKTELPARFCIAVPESLTTSGQQIVAALQGRLGPDVPLFGGGAADQWRMKGTRQFFGTEVVSDAIPVLVFSGALLSSHAVASGWRPLGEPGLVTRASGPFLFEIDGRPPLEFYRRRLGQDAAISPEFPLAVLDQTGQMQYLRAGWGAPGPEPGSVMYTGDVPQGVQVQIAIANRDAILEGCRQAVDSAFNAYPRGKTPEAALVFSCAARKLLLGTRTSDEADIVRQTLGAKVPVCGFYGYGEIGPPSDASAAEYHNETFVFLLMGS